MWRGSGEEEEGEKEVDRMEDEKDVEKNSRRSWGKVKTGDDT